MDIDFIESVVFNLRNASLDTKAFTLNTLLKITSSPGGSIIAAHPPIVRAVTSCLQDGDQDVRCGAGKVLVNMSAEQSGAAAILETTMVVEAFVSRTLDRESEVAELCSMILSNLSHHNSLLDGFVTIIFVDSRVPALLRAFNDISYNKKGCKLNHLGSLIMNLSQSIKIRALLLDRERPLIQLILPFTTYKYSVIRRRGAVGAIRNCCFETEAHQWLLGDDLDILPKILLPLAGNDEFHEDEIEHLPMELQYLDDTKQRDADPGIRKMLLETITLLCATKYGREILRLKNTYLILRELHNWETDRSVLLACENAVDILIRTEEEIGVEDIHSLSVPESLIKKFNEMDAHFLDDNK